MSPVLDARTDDFDFLLINIYNTKAEKEQASVFNVLTVVLYKFSNINNHSATFAGDFI